MLNALPGSRRSLVVSASPQVGWITVLFLLGNLAIAQTPEADRRRLEERRRLANYQGTTKYFDEEEAKLLYSAELALAGRVVETLGPFAYPRYRVRVRTVMPPSLGTALIRIETFDGDEIWRLEIKPNVKTVEWSDEITVPSPKVIVEAQSRERRLNLVLDGFASLSPKFVPQEIFGERDDRISIVSGDVPSRVQAWGRSVARLRVVDNKGPFTCTGFLVEPQRLLLTALHCVMTDEEHRSARVDFEDSRDVSPDLNIHLGLQVASSSQLDYALFRIEAPEDRPGLRLASETLSTADQLALIQEPRDEGIHCRDEKCVALNDCACITSCSERTRKLGDAVATSPPLPSWAFGHSCDTASGSSGSPILLLAGGGSDVGAVIGLHYGTYAKDGRTLRNQATLAVEIVEHAVCEAVRPDLFRDAALPDPAAHFACEIDY